MAGKNYYDLLGLKKDSSDKEIKQAYRRLARKYHPDVNPGNKAAEAKFKEMNAAYEVLSDKEKRQKYDKYGDKWQYADQIEQAQRQQGATPGWEFRTEGGQGSHFGGDIGGMDSLLGAVVGGVVIGQVLSFGQYYIGSAVQIVVLVFVGIVLYFKPTGLLGRGIDIGI